MSMFIVAGLITVLACIVTMARSNLRRWLGYATAVDMCFTLGMLYMFHGTYSGIVAASFASFFMAISLTLLIRCIGYERAKVVRWHLVKLPTVEWVYHPPVWGKNSLVSRLARGWAEMRNATGQ